jgi:hypothetical protein
VPSLSRRIAPQEVANPFGTDNLLLFGGTGKLRRAALEHQFRQDLDHVGRAQPVIEPAASASRMNSSTTHSMRIVFDTGVRRHIRRRHDNATTDEARANLGNGICATAANQCSPRAAIQQANRSAEPTRSSTGRDLFAHARRVAGDQHNHGPQITGTGASLTSRD